MMFSENGFLSRLARDTGGNTLAIGAACLIPILAGLGGAIDFGRAYVTKSRLQQSCDAGVLAGRKAQGAGAYDANAQQTAQRYFNFNFNGSPNGQRDVNFSSEGNAGTVNGTATTTLDTAIIKLFGYHKFDLTVNCGAKMNLSDTDVMFVLDTTGSMGDRNPGDSVSKIDAMRTAVKNFYETMSNSASTGTRIRYGFMPFSVTVNVGADMKPEWMAAHWRYPSRRWDHTDTRTDSGVNNWPDFWNDYYDGGEDEHSGSYQEMPKENQYEKCFKPEDNATYTDGNIGTHDHNLAQDQDWIYWSEINGTKYWLDRDGNSNCILSSVHYDHWRDIHHYHHRLVPAHSDPWSYVDNHHYYKYDNYVEDMSAYKADAGHPEKVGRNNRVSYQNFLQDPPGYGVWVDWWGCIEERWAVPLAGGGTQPAGTTGADINNVPNPSDETTQWGYYTPTQAWMRVKAADVVNNQGESWDWGHWDETKLTMAPILSDWDLPRAPSLLMSAQCSAPARKLGTIDATTLNDYLNQLTFGGMTHLDIGILWGARYLSQTGLFREENQDQSASKPTSRNIILMTDGQVETGTNVYGAYGLEAMIPRHTPAGRIPTSEELASATEKSFSEICESAKTQNMTVWVVAFGTELTPLLRNCATSGRAYMANNAHELNDAFQNIAMAMAGLQIVS